jgi:hypothetical protein
VARKDRKPDGRRFMVASGLCRIVPHFLFYA